MPLTPAGARTFLHALSDFWVLYFQDTKLLDAYAEGIAVNTAQVYQTFLETVLGASLSEVPLFDRTFYAPYSLREDNLRFVEGQGPDEDRWRFASGDALRSVEYLSNRILAPTGFLRRGREFDVSPGAFDFKGDPYEALAAFPSRHTVVVSPGAWRDPLGRAWEGVLPGDAFVLRVGSASIEATVTGTDGSMVYLDAGPTLVTQDVVRRGTRVTVLRAPWDRQKVGVALPDHPQVCRPLNATTPNPTSIVATDEINVSTLPNYKGAWATATAYAVADMVFRSGRVWQCVLAHTSGGSFVASFWDDLGSGHAYITAPSSPEIDGLYALTTPTLSGRLRLSGLPPFDTAEGVLVQRVRYTGTYASTVTLSFDHAHLDPETLTVSARREVARRVVQTDGTVITYPAGDNVQEGVDWAADLETGRVTVFTAWSVGVPARANYGWRLEMASRSYAWRGTYATATAYALGDIFLYGGLPYVVRSAHTSDGTVDPARYAPFVAPGATGVERTVREVAVWATDALTDSARLYENFGALLATERESSEVYRAFLTAVSRLFLLGPTLERFESALNAVAGLPLVREDGEVILAMESGVDVDEGGALLYGTAMGQDGALDASAGTFSSATANFFDSDVGAVLSLRSGATTIRYTVVDVLSPTVAELSPPPDADLTNVAWSYDHSVMAGRLRVSGSGYRFNESNVGAIVKLDSPTNPRNQGTFRIVAIDDPLTVVLESEFGFVDESNVDWKMSWSGEHRIVTTRREYRLPFNVPVRGDIDVGSVLRAFMPLSDAFSAVDYVEDPSWWHRVTIPEALLGEGEGTRTVSPGLIEHVYGALDDAAFGDPGFYFGANENGEPGTPRAGSAVWFGGHEVTLSFAPGTPVAVGRDTGEYLVVSTDRFRGCFRINSVSEDGLRLGLDRFPPPEARRAVPPVTLSVELPPLLYRRTIGFVLMDRALKYHSVRVTVDPAIGLTRTFLSDTLQVLSASKPTHVFLFFDALTEFRDAANADDSLELGLDYALPDPIVAGDATAFFAEGILRFGDAYRFVARTTSITPTPGVHALPTVLPTGGTPERSLVKVRFDLASRVAGRLPSEGVHYDVDYVAGTLTIRSGVTITPSPVTVNYVDCIRRLRDPGDPYDPGETDWVFGGADPTFVRPDGAEVSGACIVDRAVQLTLGP